jgi:acetyl esterase
MEVMDSPETSPAGPRASARKRAAPKARSATETAAAKAPAPSPVQSEDLVEAMGGLRRMPGSWRSRALYNRQIQRANERWPLPTRGLARLFRSPEFVLSLLGGRPPVERDGRVLNRTCQAMLELTAKAGPSGDPFADTTGAVDPVAMRRQLRMSSRMAMPIRTDVHVAGRVIPGPAGAPAMPVRVYRQYGAGIGGGRSGRSRLPAIVYFHGGGWVAGDLDSHDASCRMLAAASRCLVVSVDYRLAPEHPYPAAVDDCLAAYAWVHSNSGDLGVADGQVGVMGDSAGGNLAAVVAQLTRPGNGSAEGDLPPVVAQGLIYPVVDARLDTESMRSMGEGFFLTRGAMEYFRDRYLPDSADWGDPKASPLLADDVTGVAPALVVTAGFDPLRDDGANYAAVLDKGGVEVEYRCYDDQVHGFMGLGILPDSLALATEVCDAMGMLMRRSAGTDSWV